MPFSLYPPHRGRFVAQQTNVVLANKGYSDEEKQRYHSDFNKFFSGLALGIGDVRRIEEFYPYHGQPDTLSLQSSRQSLEHFFIWREAFEFLVRTGGASIVHVALSRIPSYCRFQGSQYDTIVRSLYDYIQEVANKHPSLNFREFGDIITILPDSVSDPSRDHYIFEPCNCCAVGEEPDVETAS